MFMLFIVIKMVETTFLISESVFHWFLPIYKEFAHETSHIQFSKYDSTSGTKISICLKKFGGWGCGSEQAPLIKVKGKRRERLQQIKLNKFTVSIWVKRRKNLSNLNYHFGFLMLISSDIQLLIQWQMFHLPQHKCVDIIR